jgi:hypothetical protein
MQQYPPRDFVQKAWILTFPGFSTICSLNTMFFFEKDKQWSSFRNFFLKSKTKPLRPVIVVNVALELCH